MDPEKVIATFEDLAAFIGPVENCPDPDCSGNHIVSAFTIGLLRLASIASWQQVCQLRSGFPREILVYEAWKSMVNATGDGNDWPIARELAARVEVEQGEIGDASHNAWAAQQLRGLVKAFAHGMW